MLPFTAVLTPLAHQLIQHFPDQFNGQIFTQVEQQQNDPNSNLARLALALSLSDFVQKVLQKQPHFLRDCWQQIPCLADCDHYAQRLAPLLAEAQDENQFYAALRQFRAREMAKLSCCQSLNLATVEQIFVRLSQLAEALIIGARDWLYERACAEMGTPTDEQGKPQLI